jgi:hypothetical protein
MGRRRHIDMTVKPLNGEKTHPLSSHAIGKLRELLTGPQPACGINPGVINRYMREDLAEIVQLPSPFKTHNGNAIAHVQITEAGRAVLAALDAAL